MPLIRGKHSFDSHFTQIPNAWLRDSRMSYKARGLLAELLSHAVGFVVSIDRIARSGKDGRDAIASAIKELETYGYLTRSQDRNPDGTLGHTTWTTCDPETAPTKGSRPQTDYPATAKPATANQLYKNTEVKNTEVKNTPTADLFEIFWNTYPRKVGKGAAAKAFSKTLVPVSEILEGAARLAADPNLPPPQYIPYPATWLNREGWGDEPYPARERTKEELAAEAADKATKRRLADLAESRRIMEQAEEAKRLAELNPVTRCEHDRVAVMCPKCSK